jgi:hypothetical protein
LVSLLFSERILNRVDGVADSSIDEISPVEGGVSMSILTKLFSPAVLKKLAWSFGRAFVATFIVGIGGIAVVPDLSAAKALLLAAATAAFTAGIRAVEQALVSSETTT